MFFFCRTWPARATLFAAFLVAILQPKARADQPLSIIEGLRHYYGTFSDVEYLAHISAVRSTAASPSTSSSETIDSIASIRFQNGDWQVLHFSDNTNVPTVEFIATNDKWLVINEMNDGKGNADTHIVSTLQGATRKAKRHRASLSTSGASIATGFFPGYVELPYLPDLLLSGSLEILSDQGNSVVLQSISKAGTCRVALQRGDNIRPSSVSFMKTAGNVVGDELIPTVEGLQSYMALYSDFEYANDNATSHVDILKAVRYEITCKYTSHTFTERGTAKFDQYVFDPELMQLAFTPSRTIADGTSVDIEESPGVVYEWRNGETKKAIDGDALSRLKGSMGFRNGIMWRLVYGLGFPILVFVVAILIRRQFVTRSKA